MNKARTLFSKVVLYLKLCIEDNGGRGRVMQQARLSSCKLIICKSLGDLHHLLARRPFSLKVIILKSGASLQKALDKVAFLLGKGEVGSIKKRINSRVQGYKH